MGEVAEASRGFGKMIRGGHINYLSHIDYNRTDINHLSS
jgi:hypothetical protein